MAPLEFQFPTEAKHGRAVGGGTDDQIDDFVARRPPARTVAAWRRALLGFEWSWSRLGKTVERLPALALGEGSHLHHQVNLAGPFRHHRKQHQSMIPPPGAECLRTRQVPLSRATLPDLTDMVNLFPGFKADPRP